MDGTFLDDQMHYNRTIFRKIYNYFTIRIFIHFMYFLFQRFSKEMLALC